MIKHMQLQSSATTITEASHAIVGTITVSCRAHGGWSSAIRKDRIRKDPPIMAAILLSPVGH
jgi:hypothetical protein